MGTLGPLVMARLMRTTDGTVTLRVEAEGTLTGKKMSHQQTPNACPEEPACSARSQWRCRMEGWMSAEPATQWKAERIPHRRTTRCFVQSEHEERKDSLSVRSWRS